VTLERRFDDNRYFADRFTSALLILVYPIETKQLHHFGMA